MSEHEDLLARLNDSHQEIAKIERQPTEGGEKVVANRTIKSGVINCRDCGCKLGYATKLSINICPRCFTVNEVVGHND